MKPRLRLESLESRDVPTAGSFLLPVGTGPGFSLSVNSTGRVAVMTISPKEYDPFFQGTNTITENSVITQRLYQFFPDIFDFVYVVNNEATPPPPIPYFGVNFPVSNYAQGTNSGGTFNFAPIYGSSGKLQSFIQFSDRTQIHTPQASFNHETAHGWANKITTEFPWDPNDPGHWNFSDVGGVLGGWERGTLQFLGNAPAQPGGTPGLYTAKGPQGHPSFTTNDGNPGETVPYAALELYLMGLIDASQVPDAQVAINAKWVINTPTQSVFQTDRKSVV